MAPAAKDKNHGSNGATDSATRTTRTAAIGSTIPYRLPNTKALKRPMPPAKYGMETAAPSGIF